MREVNLNRKDLMRYKNPLKRAEYNKEYSRDYMRKYRKSNPSYKSNSKDYNKNLRLRALKKIDSCLRCINCGCNIISILEINHINGGGNKERKKNKTKTYYLDIIYGRRKTDDLEIRCKVCNNLHYIQSKGIIGHKVIWKEPM